MGRRKKEAPSAHREAIADAAERLFSLKGIAATTMDQVANAAKYSKATLYVYFQSKEELVGVLALKSMRILHGNLAAAIALCGDTKGRYGAVCRALVDYQAQFPLYFELTLGKINVDFDAPRALPVEREIFEAGEAVMGEIAAFLRKGIAEKALREDIEVPQTVFVFWASLSGLILMAEKKRPYIEKTMGLTKEQFLEIGFETLFRSIRRQGVEA